MLLKSWVREERGGEQHQIDVIAEGTRIMEFTWMSVFAI